jgi:hypothetical protein
MSFPFRAKVRPDTFNRMVKFLRSVVERFADKRIGDVTYSMADAALGAFSVFFTQSPSFLAFQRTLQVTKGCNNALTLFGIQQIPSDNQIRNLLDPVPPAALLPVFGTVVEELHRGGHLDAYRCIGGDLLVAMDGTQYFSSTKIHCPQCSVTEHANGSITYSHSVVTPVIVAPVASRAQANDMFPTKAAAEQRAKQLACSGSFVMGKEWMPCSSFAAYQKAISKSK